MLQDSLICQLLVVGDTASENTESNLSMPRMINSIHGHNTIRIEYVLEDE